MLVTFESVMKSKILTFQMKATGQFFPVVLFIMLYKVVLTFESVNEKPMHDIQIKATRQFFFLF